MARICGRGTKPELALRPLPTRLACRDRVGMRVEEKIRPGMATQADPAASEPFVKFVV